LGRLVGAFKAVSTKRINLLRRSPGARFWQRSFYEHVIRHEEEVCRIREYISANPGRWAEDEQNPTLWRTGK
jgi:putative transposase